MLAPGLTAPEDHSRIKSLNVLRLRGPGWVRHPDDRANRLFWAAGAKVVRTYEHGDEIEYEEPVRSVNAPEWFPFLLTNKDFRVFEIELWPEEEEIEVEEEAPGDTGEEVAENGDETT